MDKVQDSRQKIKEGCYGLSNTKEQRKDDIVMIFPEIKNVDHECLLEQNQ